MRWAQRLASSAPTTGIVRLAEALGRSRSDLLRVVTYHRIAEPEDDPELDPMLRSASPRRLERQIAMIRRHYRPIAPEDLVARLRGGDALPPRAVLVSFDDAYRDFGERALPVLRRHDVRPALFVPTAFPADPAAEYWWDRLYRALCRAGERIETPLGELEVGTARERWRAQRRLTDTVKSRPHAEAMRLVDAICGEREGEPGPILDWDSLRAIEAEVGSILAPHSRRHPVLTRIGTAELAEEVRGSWHDLAREAATPVPLFAYPAGGVGDREAAAVRDAGLAGAFTVERGRDDLRRSDPFRLHRINVGPDTTTALLRAQLALAR